MALSAMFLLIFLLIHLSVNLLSLFGEEGPFNAASHFMGYNPLIQFAMQPVLIVGVVFHFVMGFVLEIKNKNARPVKYAVAKNSGNSTWMSRNMIISGAVILAFLGLHFYDFWIHEMNYKYLEGLAIDEGQLDLAFEHLRTASKYDYSMIDHVLVTELIRKNIANTFVYHDYGEYCGKYDSDHYPVVVDLLI
jgi:succinate dehydrogenase/fumarate reductase cytochrome b subunit (b558 family)